MEIKDGRIDRVIDSAYHCPQWTAEQGCPLHGEACGAAKAAGLVAEKPADTITVRISSKMFDKGLKYAKQFGGRYNPADKTWTIPTHRNGVYNNSLNAPQLYGLVPVA